MAFIMWLSLVLIWSVRRFYVEVLGLTEIPDPLCLWPGRGSGWVIARNYTSFWRRSGNLPKDERDQ